MEVAKGVPKFCVVCDIDGVIWSGGVPIPGCGEAIHKFKEHGIPVLYVTNSGGHSVHHKLEKLSMCVKSEIEEDKLVASHTPMMSLNKEQFANTNILLVGGREEDSHQIAKEFGYTRFCTLNEYIEARPYLLPHNHDTGAPAAPLEPIGGVFVLREPTDWYQALQVVIDLLRSEDGVITREGFKMTDAQKVPLFLANPDFDYADKFSVPRMTSGAFYACLAHIYHKYTGRHLHYTIYGKPMPTTYAYIEEYFKKEYGTLPEKIFAIGDNPLSDIKGANAAGSIWRSVLVRTGCFKGSENDKENPAHYVTYNLLSASQLIVSLLSHASGDTI